MSDLKNVDLKDLEIRGQLAYRAGLSYTRLEGEWYRAHEIFTADKKGWPGDWEGRTILALTLLAQVTHRPPAYLEKIFDRIPEYLNKKGYFGPISEAGIAGEQRLSGHSWYLRGLIENYKWTGDTRVLKLLNNCVENLYLPVTGHYAKYPVNVAQAAKNKVWLLSHLQSKLRTHALTIDTGCAFIALDGVTQAYQLNKEPSLRKMILQMIERYQQLDFLGYNVQTHATLSAVRGIIRFYETEGNKEHLALAEKMFNMYKEEAWTENYANYNWFGRPRWTEACAVVDSFIVATWLWKHTGNATYLEDAHHIYYNALAHAHRASGAMGSERCLGSEYVYLRVTTYEVHWCCTMRGGEAWHKAAEFTMFHNDNQLIFPFYHDLTGTIHFADGDVTLKETTGYPFDGSAKFEVLASSAPGTKTLKFFAPSWTSGSKTKVLVNGKACEAKFSKGFLSIELVLKRGTRIELDLKIGLHTQGRVCKNNTPGYHTYRHGPMILWCDNPEVIRIPRDLELAHEGMGTYKTTYTPGVANPGVVLSPINDPFTLTQPDSVKQVLFAPNRTKSHG